MIAVYLLTLFRGAAITVAPPPATGPTTPAVSTGRPVWEDGVHAGALLVAVAGAGGALTSGRPVWAGGTTPED